MSVTLKDLCVTEKQKVARLIQQIVEKERALKQSEAEAAEQAEAAAARVHQLVEQNVELARENSRCGPALRKLTISI
jgi:multidrug resistance efflux pump